ncbi:MAG: SRPBCC family protein [Planctomycetota bacterium]
MPRFTTLSRTGVDPQRTFAFIVDLSTWSSFPGYGPLPGIVRASIDGDVRDAGSPVALGSRIRVENTDRSVHHEVITAFEPGRLLHISMEPGPPASYLMRNIDERVEMSPLPDGGTSLRRTFTVTARSWLTAPIAWLICKLLLQRAVRRHNRIVERRLDQSSSTVP